MVGFMDPISPTHPYLARLAVGITIFAVSLVGLILTDVIPTGGFGYWRASSIFIALLALALSWYERRQRETIRPITLFHELLHWLGLIAAVFLISYFYHLGIISRFASGLFVLTIFSLATYLAGIFIEPSFFFIGLVLAILTAGAAFFEEYLFAFAIPLMLVAAVGLFGYHYIRHRLASKKGSKSQ